MFLTHSSFIWCYYICQSWTGRRRDNWESFCLPDHSKPHQGSKYKEWSRYLRKKILIMTDRKVSSYHHCTISHLPFHLIKYIPMAQALNVRPTVCGEECTWRCRTMKGHCLEKKHFQSQSAVLRSSGWQMGDAEILNLWYEVYQDFLSLMPYFKCNP